MATLSPAMAVERSAEATALSGAVVEVHDLAATRAFYEVLFGDAPGDWEVSGGGRRSLAFGAAGQRIEFVPRRYPRTLAHTGRHLAYQIAADRVRWIVDTLAAAGHRVNWWREDHPDERAIVPYLVDPSGNLVQLVPSSQAGPLLVHATLEAEDSLGGTLEPEEALFADALGGAVDYWHGLRVEDVREARAWRAGDDPCAPWTRRLRHSYPGHLDENYQPDRQAHAGASLQLFVRFGSARLGFVLASDPNQQEPPEGLIKGTPRLVLRTGLAAPEAAARLGSLGQPLRREEGRLFFRRPGGNFFELECNAHPPAP